ncbi:MAG: phosphoribosylglycinamide formyltransferase [Clostridiales bacterium]|nr:phosphoribosylglycinamide formyltransferase [Clostridiales bacterium]
MTKIAVLVSGSGTNLQALIDAKSNGLIPSGDISLVLSSAPDAYALTRAKEHNILTAVIEQKEYCDREAFTEAILNELQRHKIDLVVLAGFLYILSPVFTRHFENRVINVHPSLIPSFCGDGYYGLRVHEKVLEYGVKLTGATVHFVNEETDAGPIILQKAVPVNSDDTPQTLQQRVMEQAEWVILPQAVNLFCEGCLRVEGRHVFIE